MPAGWSAKSLIPAGLGGFSGGSGIVTRGSLGGGVAPPMNTINATMPSGTGVPPFISGALNPFLSAVIGQQNRPTAAPMPNITINTGGGGDEKLKLAQQQAAQRAANSTQWEIDRLQGQLGNIPTGFGGMAVGNTGAQRADLQMRLFGLQNQLGRQQSASFGQGGWSNTFAIPQY